MRTRREWPGRRSPFPVGALAGERVPWVDEPECVGCNLCQLVCPVPGCITMQEVANGPKETWNERVGARRGQGPRRHPRLGDKASNFGVGRPVRFCELRDLCASAVFTR